VLSIIVPARNGPELTGRCLGSILFSLSRLQLPAEFILIDDASPASEQIVEVFRRTRANASGQGHEWKIVRSKTHRHYSGVFSIGLELATRDAIFFISNDMMVTPTFIQTLLAVSALSEDFGIVRGTSNFTDSHPEHRVEPPQELATYKEIFEFSSQVFNGNGCRFVEDHVLSGDAILVKRALVQRIGALDLRFFGYFGDIDYGMRAHLAGFKLVCAKGAWLYHEGCGHVRREVELMGESWEARRNSRLKDVDRAYQEFRGKWHIAAPEHYADAMPVHYFEHARAHSASVELRYVMPPAAMNDLDYY
jgi:GT2 family glycosyltransferase